MIEPAEPNVTPPGGWRWVHPESGMTLTASSWNDLVVAARRFLANNNYPIPRDISEVIARWLDDTIQADVASRGLPPYNFLQSTEDMSLKALALRFASEAVNWAKNGFKTVSAETYRQRLESCQGCGYWQGESGFGLGRCGKCGCYGLKLFASSTKCPLDPPRWDTAL